jgi:hypothetical protein
MRRSRLLPALALVCSCGCGAAAVTSPDAGEAPSENAKPLARQAEAKDEAKRPAPADAAGRDKADAAAPVEVTERKVVYNGEMRLIVSDLDASEVALRKLLKEYGGYVNVRSRDALHGRVRWSLSQPRGGPKRAQDPPPQPEP